MSKAKKKPKPAKPKPRYKAATRKASQKGPRKPRMFDFCKSYVDCFNLDDFGPYAEGNVEDLTSPEARKLSAWLLRFADWAEAQ